MNILLKKIKVLDRNSSKNGKNVDIGIVNGKITFNVSDKQFNKTIECKGCVIAPGFMDMRAFLGEPGYEYKEDFNSFQNAANRGGYTAVAVLPNTSPVIDNKDIVGGVLNKSQNVATQLFPIAALSKGTKGEELSEMIDLHENGAVAFSDGYNPIYHSDLILKGLQYGKYNDSLIINTPMDYHLSKKGYVNEGVEATALGMPGIPQLAEEIAIERDLKLLEYAGGRLHLSLITTEKGLKLIKEAKKKGLNVTCDVGAHYLAFDDSCLSDFDTNHKVFPPYRTKKDIKALQKGLQDGTIDCIVSDHRPENIENKKLEFDKASFGISSIETAFSTICTYSDMNEQQIIEKLSYSPREILKIEVPKIEEGETANISIVNFNTDNHIKIESKSKNNPFIGLKLRGKVLGIVNAKNSWFNEN